MRQECKTCRYRKLRFGRCRAQRLRWAWHDLLRLIPLVAWAKEKCDWRTTE